MTDWLHDLYQQQIVDPGKQPVLLLLAGLVGGFVVIRASTRLIRARARFWPGNVHVGGVHVHHLLVGVVLMLVCGAASFVAQASAARDWLALGFGVGVGLVLDEFALLLHLRDVYWQREGRTSVDAVLVGVVLTAMLVVGAAPFGFTGAAQTRPDGALGRWFAVGLVALNLVLTVVTALKGKIWMAILSVPVWVVGLVGAVRLARPDSPWARRRYDAATLERAEERSRRWDRARHTFVTLVGGRFEHWPRPHHHVARVPVDRRDPDDRR
ncbi:hypothetical protein [Angustibacter aerolatus]|nr:hypothetical protein [Angustibacter aerolatus]